MDGWIVLTRPIGSGRTSAGHGSYRLFVAFEEIDILDI